MRPFSFSYLVGSLLVLFCFQISPVCARVDTLRMFPEQRFEGRGKTLGRYLAENLRYPSQAQKTGIVGTSIVSILIAPTGKIVNVAIVNPVSNDIDGEVLRVFRSTKKYWLPADPAASQDSMMMIIPITFSLTNGYTNSAFYVEPVKPEFILTELIVVGYGQSMFMKDDAYYKEELNSAFLKKDFKQMLKMVNELIRRNPYSDKLYLQRANIERELGQTEEACNDYKKIIYFLGKAHFPKKFIQNCP